MRQAPMLRASSPATWNRSRSRPTSSGLNVYAGNFVRAGADGLPEVLPFPRGYPEGALWWLKLTPQSMYWSIRHAAEVFGVKTFYITESGATFDDDLNSAGGNYRPASSRICTQPPGRGPPSNRRRL